MFESCRNCKPPKRQPGCHDHCTEYQKDRAAYDEKKKAADTSLGRAHPTVYGQMMDAIDRVRRHRKRKHYGR